MAKNISRIIKIKVEVEGTENAEMLAINVHDNVPSHIIALVRKQIANRNTSIPIRRQVFHFYKAMLDTSEVGKFWKYTTTKVESRFKNEKSEPILGYVLDRLRHLYLRTPPVVSNFDSYERISNDNGESITTSWKFKSTLTWNEVKIHRNSIRNTAKLLQTLLDEAPRAISDELKDSKFLSLVPVLADLASKADGISIPHKTTKSGGRSLSKNSSINKIFSEEVLILFDHILGEPHYARCKLLTNLLYPKSTITVEILKKSWAKMPYKRKKAHLIAMSAQNKGV